MIVIDASVALAWCLDDESNEYADKVQESVVDGGGIAPSHWPLEVANALLNAERRGRIEVNGAASASRLLDRFGVEVVPIELTTATWGILDTARAHGLTVYDAAYLDLARFRGIPLATLDERLRSACQNAGVALVD